MGLSLPLEQETGDGQMQMVFKSGAVEIWQVREGHGFDYYVYGLTSDPRVCPSLEMARAVAAAALA